MYFYFHVLSSANPRPITAPIVLTNNFIFKKHEISKTIIKTYVVSRRQRPDDWQL